MFMKLRDKFIDVDLKGYRKSQNSDVLSKIMRSKNSDFFDCFWKKGLKTPIFADGNPKR